MKPHPYNLIGDTHGQHDKLTTVLDRMGMFLDLGVLRCVQDCWGCLRIKRLTGRRLTEMAFLHASGTEMTPRGTEPLKMCSKAWIVVLPPASMTNSVTVDPWMLKRMLNYGQKSLPYSLATTGSPPKPRWLPRSPAWTSAAASKVLPSPIAGTVSSPSAPETLSAQI